MSNPRLAGRYAKSLLDLAIEQNQLDAICEDIKFLQAICKSNPDFVAMLKSPVIKSDTKVKIIEAIAANKITKLTTAFLDLLIKKTREYSLPEIAKAFIEQYNKLNDIHTVKITTAVPMSNELRDVILNKITSTTSMKKVELETAVKDELIGGFTLEMAGTLVDASIQRDLNDVKKQFKSNEYIHSIR
jgi:F-type H+-transporting ATPase subunit delta